MVRYYGFYFNKSRGLRKKADTALVGEAIGTMPKTADSVPAMIESDVSSKALRQNWARMIKKYTKLIRFFVSNARGPCAL